MLERSLRIGLVTPFAWSRPSAVNRHIAMVARELVQRGHRPCVLASTRSHVELKRMRSVLAEAETEGLHRLLGGAEPGVGPHPFLLPSHESGYLKADDGVPVAIVGRAFTLRNQGRMVSVGLPVDMTLRLERLLASGQFDVLHVHEPLAPSLSFSAVRLARCPVVATFHLTPAGAYSYEIGRSVLPRFLEKLDARLAGSAVAAELLSELLGGEYEVLRPGSALSFDRGGRRPAGAGQSLSTGSYALLYVYRGDDRRGLRAFYRAVSRETRGGGASHVLVAIDSRSRKRWRPLLPPRSIESSVETVTFSSDAGLTRLYDRASAVCVPCFGGEWLHDTLMECAVLDVPCVGPDLPLVREYAENGWVNVRLFRADGGRSLASALPSSAEGMIPGIKPVELPELRIPRVVDRLTEIYAEGAGRGGAKQAFEPGHTTRVQKKRTRRPIEDSEGRIFVDLHVHTDHSGDCSSAVSDVLTTARQLGLGGLAIADHNTISGALEARRMAGDDLLVIVAEEIKTKEGEVIGLFLEEEIPGGLGFEHTLDLIEEQGALVYVPHPFDRLHFTPSYGLLARNAERIDVIEIYNARLAFESFNATAERFAEKYRILAGAGSDAHVLAGLGTAMVRMPPFSGPETFLAGLRDSDVLSNRKSVLYVQSLKLIQNTLDRVLPQH